jgi:hypothetical protein
MAMSAVVAAEGRSGVDEFDPDDYHFGSTATLVHPLRRAIAHKQDVVFTLAGVGDLTLLPNRGEWFTSAHDMRRLCTAPSHAYEVRCLTSGEVDAIVRRGPGRNIDEIMWQAGYYASNGRLIDGCKRDDVVELRHWPNLTRLPAPPNAMLVAALLSRYPTSITLAARLLKVPISEMFEFYTAAHCAGLAVAVNRKPEMPRFEPHRNRTLLSQLLSRIAGM